MFAISNFVESLAETAKPIEVSNINDRSWDIFSPEEYSSICYSTIIPPDEILMRKEDETLDPNRIWDRKAAKFFTANKIP